jgi:hypothetical protein
MRQYGRCGSRLYRDVPQYDDPWTQHLCNEPLPASFPVPDPTKGYYIALQKGSVESVINKALTLNDGTIYSWDLAITDGFETTGTGEVTDKTNVTRTVKMTTEDEELIHIYHQKWDDRQGLIKSEEVIDRATVSVIIVFDVALFTLIDGDKSEKNHIAVKSSKNYSYAVP